MSKLPTAEEFAKKNHIMKTYPADWNVMIEFAKMHVEAALKEASEKVILDYGDYLSDGNYERIIDKDSILNSYSLDNIK